MGGEQIAYTSSVRNLGLIIDQSLSWEAHIDVLCTRVYVILRSFWQLTGFAGVKFRHKLFMAYILPHLMYCDVVLYGMFEKVMDKLRYLFNSCVRYVYSLRKFDHISMVSSTLLGCDINKFFEYRTCLFIHKLILNKSPSYLYNKIHISKSEGTKHIILPVNNSRSFNSSFFVQGVSNYNKLPGSVRSCKSLRKFMIFYKDWYVLY